MGSAINRLTTTDSMNTSDIIPKWDGNDSDDRGISYANLLSELNADLTFPGSSRKPEFTKQYSTPTAGSTITVTDGADNDSNMWLIITPAGTLATLTIKLPAVADLADLQEILVYCSQEITALTINVNGATAVINGPSALAANQTFKLKYDSQSMNWYNIQAPA